MRFGLSTLLNFQVGSVCCTVFKKKTDKTSKADIDLAIKRYRDLKMELQV